jgi:hypothetical protein
VAILTVLLSVMVSACASYIVSRFSFRRQQRWLSENYKLALITEIRALEKKLRRYETAFNNRVLTGEVAGALVLKIYLQPGDTTVFTSSASTIGLFDNCTALRVLRFYSDIRTIYGHALALAEAAGDTGTQPSEQDIRHHQAMLRHARRRAHALVKRLTRPNRMAVTRRRLRRRLRAWRGA